MLSVPIRTDSRMVISTRLKASVTNPVELTALYSNKRDGPVLTRKINTFEHRTGDRTTEIFDTPVPGRWLWDASLHPNGDPSRGQMYGVVNLSLFGVALGEGRGYLTTERGPSFGVDEDPLSGRGYLDWIQLADDIAGNVNSTLALAATNAYRKIRAFQCLYHSSGDVATRTLEFRIRDYGLVTKPTRWSIEAKAWASATLTLTQNEEGMMYFAEDHFGGLNDAGTLSYADRASAPNLLPLYVDGTEGADLMLVIGAGEAADDYDIWALIEEWLI